MEKPSNIKDPYFIHTKKKKEAPLRDMEIKSRVHKLNESAMITGGTELAEYTAQTSSAIPSDLRLVPYHMLHRDEKAKTEWDRILRSKYIDRFFLRKIDSMAMHLVHCNMSATISNQVSAEKTKVAKANRLWANSMKHVVVVSATSGTRKKLKKIPLNTSAFYVILEFLVGPATTWCNQTKPRIPKKRKHDDEDDANENEEEDAIEMWKSPAVKCSAPTTLLNFKFVCKTLYKMIDWRAIAFTFQRYVHPAFKIASLDGWNNVAYFRDYVLRRCMIPDFPRENRGSISISAMQPLLHRYANFCYRRLGVVMFYTRTKSAITRRIFFVGSATVNKAGVPQIQRKSKVAPQPWDNIKEVRGDLVQRDGVIHSGVSKRPEMFLAVPSGWNALEPSVFMIAESQDVFCGTDAKTSFELLCSTDLTDSKSKKEKEEDDLEDDDQFESHDGWLEFDDQIAEIEQEIEGEGEYVQEDEPDYAVAPRRRSTRALTAHTSAGWLREEEEEEKVIPKTRKGKMTVHGLMDEARNEIDDLECEEEYCDDDDDERRMKFKTKRRK